MTSPLISLIVPCFNEQRRVKESIEAIAAFFSAEEEEFELVIVDDGSTDHTLSLIHI